MGLLITNKMAAVNFKIHMVDAEHYLFGGKGDVWGNTIHIARKGAETLCGKPMLSTNWAGFEEAPTAGCKVCITMHNLYQRRN